MWHRLSEGRAGSPLLIEELLTLVQPGIRPALESILPPVSRAVCQGATRRSPHALLALLLTEPRVVIAVRQWLASPFLVDVLPPLLNDIERGIAGLVRRVSSKMGSLADAMRLARI